MLADHRPARCGAACRLLKPSFVAQTDDTSSSRRFTMLRSMIFPCAVLSMLAIEIAGCGAGRDVEVTGSVSAAASVQVQGPILLQFLDVLADDQKPTVAYTPKLDALGAFTQKEPLEGKQSTVRAINEP